MTITTLEQLAEAAGAGLLVKVKMNHNATWSVYSHVLMGQTGWQILEHLKQGMTITEDRPTKAATTRITEPEQASKPATERERRDRCQAEYMQRHNITD